MGHWCAGLSGVINILSGLHGRPSNISVRRLNLMENYAGWSDVMVSGVQIHLLLTPSGVPARLFISVFRKKSSGN